MGLKSCMYFSDIGSVPISCVRLKKILAGARLNRLKFGDSDANGA